MAFPSRNVAASDCQLNWEYLDPRLPAAPVTALPTEGNFPGRRITYFTGTAGVYWELSYTGEATYPWAYVGGGALYQETTSTAALAHASGTYADQITVTCPLAGDYLATASVGLLQTTAGNDTVVVVTPSAARTANHRMARGANAGVAYEGSGRVARFPALAAGASLAVSVFHVAAGAGSTVGYLGLAVTPQRVG